MTSRLFLLLALAFSAQAYAADTDCAITENIVLTQPWIFYCDGDVLISEGVQIITHEHEFKIRTSGTIKYGSLKNPAVIKCTDTNDRYDMTGRRCGEVFVQASVLDGALRQDCSAPGTASCVVEVQTASYSPTYHQSLNTDLGGRKKFILSNDVVSTNVRWVN